MIRTRPQPVGLFAYPASHLLLPAVPDEPSAQAALDCLLKGDLETEVPEAWMFFKAAALGRAQEALALVEQYLTQAAQPDRETMLYNQFVLHSASQSQWAPGAEVTDPVLQELMKVAAYSAGLVDCLPENWVVDDELLAHALSVKAAAQVEADDRAAARMTLKQAIELARRCSPLLAGLLTVEHCELVQRIGAPSEDWVAHELRQAIALAQGSQLDGLLSELWMKLGITLQQAATGDRQRLLETIAAYQAAWRSGLDAERHPHTFALLQNNLGLAYLSMPQVETSYQLRAAIAVQSFRKALEVLVPDSDIELWASINMNLASALVYLPTSHPQENLISAVQLYDQVLSVRTRDRDPVAYALVLLNQANALAHLGMFKPAMENLGEAYKLFHCHGQNEHAQAAYELMEQVHLARESPRPSQHRLDQATSTVSTAGQ